MTFKSSLLKLSLNLYFVRNWKKRAPNCADVWEIVRKIQRSKCGKVINHMVHKKVLGFDLYIRQTWNGNHHIREPVKRATTEKKLLPDTINSSWIIKPCQKKHLILNSGKIEHVEPFWPFAGHDINSNVCVRLEFCNGSGEFFFYKNIPTNSFCAAF